MNPARTIDDRRRFLLWAASMAVALAAAVLMMFPTDDSTGWQVLLTVVTLVFLGTSPWLRLGLVGAATSMTAIAAIALVDTEFAVLPLMVSGVLAFAAIDLMALLPMWRSVGRLDVDAERRHLVAVTHRSGLGGIVAGGIMLVGAIELPSPGIAAALGIVAAAAVIVLTASRSA